MPRSICPNNRHLLGTLAMLSSPEPTGGGRKKYCLTKGLG